MPLSASLSWREPRISQTPIETDRTCGIDSVTRRNPEGNVSAQNHEQTLRAGRNSRIGR